MTKLLWAVVIGTVAAIAYLCWRRYRSWQDQQRAEEERFAAFIAGTMGSASPSASAAAATAIAPMAQAASTLALEKLLFEAAGKAAEAAEPALALQLFARLLERYPATVFAPEAQAAMEAQTRKLAKS